jgi:hypothetical protein
VSERTAAICDLYILLCREPEIAGALLRDWGEDAPPAKVPAPSALRRRQSHPGQGRFRRGAARRPELTLVDALALAYLERLTKRVIDGFRRSLPRHGGR